MAPSTYRPRLRRPGIFLFLTHLFRRLSLIPQKKRLAIFYGSQTGTAEDYAIRLAKEAKSKFGLGSLVCDAEEYDYENLDQVPEDCCVFFVVATYGEGEPTDNAVQLVSCLRDDDFAYSNGSHTLDGLKYV